MRGCSRTAQGGRIAYEQVELAQRFSDPAFVAQLRARAPSARRIATSSRSTGYSADGLVEVSRLEPSEDDIAHPYAWFGRRVRDTHDIWHVLTGYKADESLGEAALVAFSYAQVGGLGWAFIGVGGGAEEPEGDRQHAVRQGGVGRLSPRPQGEVDLGRGLLTAAPRADRRRARAARHPRAGRRTDARSANSAPSWPRISAQRREAAPPPERDRAPDRRRWRDAERR